MMESEIFVKNNSREKEPVLLFIQLTERRKAGKEGRIVPSSYFYLCLLPSHSFVSQVSAVFGKLIELQFKCWFPVQSVQLRDPQAVETDLQAPSQCGARNSLRNEDIYFLQ